MAFCPLCYHLAGQAAVGGKVMTVVVIDAKTEVL